MSIAPRIRPTRPDAVLRALPRAVGAFRWGRRHLAGPRRVRSCLLSLLLGAVALLTACGSAPPPLPTPIDVDRAVPASVRATPPTPAGTPAATGTVTIADFQFAPLSILVRPGAQVTWTNSGRAIHRVVADSGVFDKGQLAPGASTAQTFAQPGSYPYHCAIHPTMRATVVVQ